MKLENVFVKDEFLRKVNLSLSTGKIYFINGDETANILLATIGLNEKIILGNYYIDNNDIVGISNRKITQIRKKHFGFIFPNPLLENELTVFENLLLPLEFSHKDQNIKQTIVKKTLQKLGLEDLSDKYPSDLSILNQQKTSLARALINNPQIIIAENAIDMLSKEDAEEFLQILKNLCHNNMSIIITGNPKIITPFADELINVYKGEIKC